jgi:DNA-binding transcriptional regulator YiaG
MRTDINVKKLREDLRMTQVQLAAEVGVDQSTVSLWETGETTPRGPALKLLTMLGSRNERRKRRIEQEGASA